MGTFIAMLSASIQFALATFGAYMSLRRPTATPHFRWFVVFIVLGISGITMTALQAHHATVVQDGLRASIENVPKNTAAEFIKSGGNVAAITKPKPWWLTPEQISVLARRMAPFADGINRTGLVMSRYYDAETERFAAGFIKAFQDAGWNVPGKLLTRRSYQHYHPGIDLMVHSQEQMPKGLHELAQTLQEFEIDSTISTNVEVPEDQFEIVIGARPKD